MISKTLLQYRVYRYVVQLSVDCTECETGSCVSVCLLTLSLLSHQNDSDRNVIYQLLSGL